MLSLRLSLSVLTPWCPHCVLSRVRFVGPCPPPAPLPPPCVNARLPCPCCHCPRRSGRCSSSSSMVPVPPSSTVGFCDGRALARRTTSVSPCGWAGVTCVDCVVHRRLPAASACVVASVPSRARDLLYGRSIRYCLSLFFLSPHPQIVNSDGATPFLRAGVTVHTDLGSCSRPRPDSSPSSGYLYVLFFSFSSPFLFPPHLPRVAPILSLVKLVFFPG
jgi:hypothetical protein